MFGLNFTTIFLILALVGAGIGYFKYTQDKIDEMNREIATKDFALKASEETIKKQKEDMEQQAKALEKANSDMKAARDAVEEIQGKFNKGGRDFGNFVEAAPSKAEQHINAASKKSWRCIEETVNKEQANGDC